LTSLKTASPELFGLKPQFLIHKDNFTLHARRHAFNDRDDAANTAGTVAIMAPVSLGGAWRFRSHSSGIQGGGHIYGQPGELSTFEMFFN
jgi:hypothetical protein